MQFQVSRISRDECGAGEWEARVDLAAAHRLAVMHGLSEGIYNHLTQVVPGKPDRYYQIPFGMHWSEVKASSFMEVGINDGEVKRGSGDVERSCYCIHAPIHKALPQAKVVFHTHMPFASALTRLEDPCIKEIGQTEVGMMEMIAYDDNYAPCQGPQQQNGAVHGQPRRYDGRSIGSRRIQPALLHRARSAGANLRNVDRSTSEAATSGRVEKTKKDIGGAHLYSGPTPAERHFCALKRILDREEADYAS